MRRTPYTERGYRQTQNISIKEPGDFLTYTANKSDLPQRQSQNIQTYMQAKNTKPYHMPSRNARSTSKRPISVNKSNSGIKSRNQDREEIPSRNKNLWVSTVREDKQRVDSRDYEHSRGKIYRGSSWKPEEKIKSPIPSIRQQKQVKKFVKASRYLSNLTPTTKQQRFNMRQSNRNNNIYDLIGKNLKKKDEHQIQVKQTKDQNFFEYVMRFSYRTKKGSIPSNPGKVNQDVHILSPNINNKTWQHFFSVCDGHGPLGHFVSAYIKNTLPNVINSMKNLQSNPVQTLMKAFQITYQKMIKQSRVDMSFSGSTIIGLYMLQNKLYSCNVGDSRAILGRQQNGQWSAIALSEDHKPTLPKEVQRIKKMNGRVQAYKDQFGQPIGPLRVWIQQDNVPGLAMTRSFGDLVGASVGVSPVPQIKQFNLTDKDKIILIASDGVFEFLQNEEIIESLVPFYQKNQIQQASDHLLNLSHRTWTQNSSIIDDITFILIFINYNEI